MKIATAIVERLSGLECILVPQSSFDDRYIPQECLLQIGKDDVVSRVSHKIRQIIVEQELFLDRNLTLEKLAKLVGSNRTYMSQVFSREKGVFFNHYINTLRLEYANKIVGQRWLSMEEIAILSGFKTDRTFYRALKECDCDGLDLLKKRYLCKN